MKKILDKLLLCYIKIIYSLFYARINYFMLSVILILYTLTLILFIVCSLGDLDIISVNSDTKNFIDELDFTSELPEINTNIQAKEKRTGNIFTKFLNLFNNNNNNIQINIKEQQLKNAFYINEQVTKSRNQKEFIEACDKHLEVSLLNAEIKFLVDCLSDALKTIDSIEYNISTNTW